MLPIRAPILLSKESYTRQILSTNPLVYWPLNETNGTTFYDATGHGFNGSYTGVTLGNTSAPGGGQCPLFDGINDKAEILGANLTALRASLNHSEFTFAAWAKVLNAAVWTDGAYREVFGIQVFGDNNNRMYFLKNIANNNFQFIYNDNNAATKLHNWLGQSSVDWMFFVQSISASMGVMRSYINNVQFGSPSTSVGAYINDPNIKLGVNAILDNSWWKGWIARAAMWNRALTDGEISILYYGGL